MIRIGLVVTLVLAVIGCKRAEDSNTKTTSGSAAAPSAATASTPAPSTGSATSAAPDGVRVIPIDVVMEGYKPDRIVGKPGEKLKLLFTRKVDGECFEQLKAPDGKLHDLPKNKPYEIAVTVPMDGEVKFACGMDMLQGTIVAEKG